MRLRIVCATIAFTLLGSVPLAAQASRAPNPMRFRRHTGEPVNGRWRLEALVAASPPELMAYRHGRVDVPGHPEFGLRLSALAWRGVTVFADERFGRMPNAPDISGEYYVSDNAGGVYGPFPYTVYGRPDVTLNRITAGVGYEHLVRYIILEASAGITSNSLKLGQYTGCSTGEMATAGVSVPLTNAFGFHLAADVRRNPSSFPTTTYGSNRKVATTVSIRLGPNIYF